MKHTPEPWFTHHNGNFIDITIGGQYDLSIANTCQSKCCWNDEVEAANAARIVACVNACAGIEKPEDLRRQRDDLREEMKSIALAVGRSKTDGESDCDWHDLSGDVETVCRQRDELATLLREARITLEMWKDVAPAVSLCADIEKLLAKIKVTP